jgi:hypothetical protein
LEITRNFKSLSLRSWKQHSRPPTFSEIDPRLVLAKSFKQLSAALSPEARRLVQLRVQIMQKRIDSKEARRAKSAPVQTAEIRK